MNNSRYVTKEEARYPSDSDGYVHVTEDVIKKVESVEMLNSDKGVFQCYETKSREGYFAFGVYSVEEDGTRMHIYGRADGEAAEEYIKVPEEEAVVKYTVSSEKSIEKPPFYTEYCVENQGPTIIYPMSLCEAVLRDAAKSMENHLYFFYYLSSDYEASEKAINRILAKMDFKPSLITLWVVMNLP